MSGDIYLDVQSRQQYKSEAELDVKKIEVISKEQIESLDKSKKKREIRLFIIQLVLL